MHGNLATNQAKHFEERFILFARKQKQDPRFSMEELPVKVLDTKIPDK